MPAIDLSAFGVDADSLPDQRVISLPFEPYLELVDPAVGNELDLLTDDLCQDWMQTKSRKPNVACQQDFMDCMRVILANLIRIRLRAEIATVGIGRGKTRLDQERRYRPSYLSVSYFLQALDFLAEKRFIRMVSLGYQNDGLSEVSRYALTEQSDPLWRPYHLTKSSFRVGACQELIRLKDATKRLVHYSDKDAPETVPMRSNLERINALLLATEIEAPRGRKDVSNEQAWLYRIFNNGSFTQGGRFYGGWWQVRKKQTRRRIKLDGVATVEADFKAFNPSVLLAQHGYPIPTDPYALVPGVTENAELRVQVKETFNALINATEVTYLPKKFDSARFGMSAQAFRQTVVDAYSMLPGIFGSGAGLRLMRIESDIAEEVMLHFVEQGEPILPMHDAFMVKAHLKDELVSIMKDTFYRHTGQYPGVDCR